MPTLVVTVSEICNRARKKRAMEAAAAAATSTGSGGGAGGGAGSKASKPRRARTAFTYEQVGCSFRGCCHFEIRFPNTFTFLA